ncbi:chemotaxis protein CheB [Leptolyngbya sp. FACHB-16]|uniref:chemotaxis protein CheB n=1 Tax=unclassified Leptolyngbya TaxID=2650499 RepID=UPI001F555B2F|nr:chemotaxis protein CheB [Leptolyngbya sp. FACHB-16]
MNAQPDYIPAKLNIIVVGASAGGVEMLTQLAKHLPETLEASLFIVVHFPSQSTSFLPKILSRVGKLPVRHPQDGESIRPGHIYIAPPDYHLLIQKGQMRLSQGPRENGHRPAIDTLFHSAARSYGRWVTGVLLSGALDDGVAGLAMVKSQGGLAIVQDPAEVAFDGMVRSAIANVDVDYILPIEAIAHQLVQLSEEFLEGAIAMPEDMIHEAERVAEDKTEREEGQHFNSPSPMTCPDCGGVLWELREGELIRFRCHVGHAYSMDSLVAEQTNDVERALWSALRALEEKAALARRLAAHARSQARSLSENQFMTRADEAEKHATIVRQVVMQQKLTKSHTSISPEDS